MGGFTWVRLGGAVGLGGVMMMPDIVMAGSDPFELEDSDEAVEHGLESGVSGMAERRFCERKFDALVCRIRR